MAEFYRVRLRRSGERKKRFDAREGCWMDLSYTAEEQEFLVWYEKMFLREIAQPTLSETAR